MFVSIIRRIFGWWHVASIGTLLHTYFKGVKVGEDVLGNQYYISKNGDKRWVIFNGEIEATNIQPEWHAWLHKIVDQTPLEKPRTIKSWEKDHLPNQTGTINAYSPSGALSEGGNRASSTGDYEAWTPNN
ncbi:MAG: NADH:ubiquinone oxidoreductase subunit NDUFA12 [Kordiimonadaceae bacterium]|jgi:NADH:ubiquinone oxidoreductase subunit|nr:NADH:ubiquinone oxidoreductase subunit NDUFA12 [Kordiimonadaceae bacterium]MBT6033530.1 NADH:ubiquinone oxidoreductase subunit NDUFA12 [Kordiimonadaceae bacterium]